MKLPLLRHLAPPSGIRRPILRALLALSISAAAAQQPGTIAIDTQEWRDTPARHLYIHGVLNGDTAFHVYLPGPADWKGRLFQYLQGGIGGSENEGVRMGNHVYAMANGGVYVESSQGHIGTTLYEPNNTPNELAYEASYAVVQYAKSRCVELYGKEPAYTYIYGGSGGGVRSTGLLERFPKVYDGAVPVVGAGNLYYFTYLQSMYEYHRPAIQDRVADLARATRVPGQGDPFAVLENPAQREAFEMLLRTGYPRNSLWLVRPLVVSVTALDFLKYKAYPRYFDEFWTKPGYGGAAGEFNAQLEAGVECTVKSVDADQRRIVTDLDRPNFALFAWTIEFTSGAAKGEWRRVLGNQGASLVIGPMGPGVEQVKPGDRARLDNRDLLAFRALHRHMTDDPQDPAMRHLFAGGKPKHRQIPGEALRDAIEVGRTMGRFAGKMIMMFGADDPLMWPTVAARYHRRVREAGGAAVEERYRLHYLEHGVHGAAPPAMQNRQIPNRAAVCKALDDLMAWVERGIAPVPGTTYAVDERSQIVLPGTAAARKGYQPVVAVAVQHDGAEAVLTVTAEDPDNEIARIEVDWEGGGKFAEAKDVRGRSVKEQFRHKYAGGGTYFPVVRVTDTTQGPGRMTPGIQNLATARIVIP